MSTNKLYITSFFEYFKWEPSSYNKEFIKKNLLLLHHSTDIDANNSIAFVAFVSLCQAYLEKFKFSDFCQLISDQGLGNATQLFEDFDIQNPISLYKEITATSNCLEAFLDLAKTFIETKKPSPDYREVLTTFCKTLNVGAEYYHQSIEALFINPDAPIKCKVFALNDISFGIPLTNSIANELYGSDIKKYIPENFDESEIQSLIKEIVCPPQPSVPKKKERPRVKYTEGPTNKKVEEIEESTLTTIETKKSAKTKIRPRPPKPLPPKPDEPKPDPKPDDSLNLISVYEFKSKAPIKKLAESMEIEVSTHYSKNGDEKTLFKSFVQEMVPKVLGSNSNNFDENYRLLNILSPEILMENELGYITSLYI